MLLAASLRGTAGRAGFERCMRLQALSLALITAGKLHTAQHAGRCPADPGQPAAVRDLLNGGAGAPAALAAAQCPCGAFVELLKLSCALQSGDDLPLYGVCCMLEELVQPAALAASQCNCGGCFELLKRTCALQSGDNLPLYGICCMMEELVHQPPWLLRSQPMPAMPLTRTIPVAQRCYCLLTHYPFFTLHFKVCCCCKAFF